MRFLKIRLGTKQEAKNITLSRLLQEIKVHGSCTCFAITVFVYRDTLILYIVKLGFKYYQIIYHSVLPQEKRNFIKSINI